MSSTLTRCDLVPVRIRRLFPEPARPPAHLPLPGLLVHAELRLLFWAPPGRLHVARLLLLQWRLLLALLDGLIAFKDAKYNVSDNSS